MFRYEHTFGFGAKPGKAGATNGLVNWLLAGPTPDRSQPHPRAETDGRPLPGNDEVIAPTPKQTHFR